jgi:CheY-like chemotaxis protein
MLFEPAVLEPNICKRSVLVVDDDPINRAVAAGLLGRLGHKTTLADGGEAGVKAASEADFDILLMDLHMPGIDGLETARRIRALPATGRRGQIPVVALTADLSEDTLQHCALAGIDKVLSKPLQLESLRRALAAFDNPEISPDSPATVRLDREQLIDASFLAEQLDILGAGELVRLGWLLRRVSQETIAAIERALASNDRTSIQQLAHRLRSAAGALALARFHEALAMIEANAKVAREERLHEMVVLLTPLRRASLRALLAEIGKRSGTAQRRSSAATPSL